MASRVYENYLLDRDELSVRAGLLPVPRSMMTTIIGGFVTGSSLSASVLIGLGIEFSGENGIKYTRAAVSHGGAVVLIDPAAPTTVTATSAFDAVCSNLSNNTSIRSTFLSSSLLLCPWWDPSQRTVASDVYQLTRSFSATTFRLLKYGAIRPEDVVPPGRLDVDGGVTYTSVFNSDRGKCSVIRWCTQESQSESSRVMRYEAALYENGLIEFRYLTPAQTQPSGALPQTGSAIVGAFFPSGTLRFRDMSPIVTDRTAYELGGFTYTSSYADRGAPYCVSNSGHAGWPGAIRSATYSFRPGQALRQVLPRKVVKHTSNQAFSPLYSDRRSIPATVGMLDAPVASSYLDFDGDGADRSDLFRIQAHCIRSRSLSDIGFFARPTVPIAPFCDNIIDDPQLTLASASSVNVNDPNSTTRLGSRHSLDYSIRITRQSKFIPGASSGMIFDASTGCFVLVGVDRARLPSDEAQRAAEDGNGFNAVGHFMASGAYQISSQSQSTLSPGLYSSNGASQADMLSAYYSESITLSDSYLTFNGLTKYEPFRPALRRPFVVEAVEIELPVKANNAWFQDMTTVKVNTPSASFSGWNLGGPGLTVAVLVDRGSALRKFRDVLATGSITHISDATTIGATVTSLLPTKALVAPLGFRTCGGTPAGVINATSGPFTGSVKLFMPAASAVGSFMALTGSTTTTTFLQTLPVNDSLSQLTQSFGWLNAIPVHLTPFGRSHDGASISARSVLMRESAVDTAVKNSFVLTGSAITTLSSSLTGYSTVTYVGCANNVASTPSPYVLLPGDGLRIQVARSRAAITGSLAVNMIADMDAETKSIFGFVEGDIKLRLIGRYLVSGKLSEIHDAESTEEIIGAEPVIDQLDFFGRQELFGTIYDGYVTGSYVNRSAGSVTLGAERGRVFSIANASASQQFDTSLYSVALTKSSWLAGFNGISYATCESERYYDSMLPPIDQITRLNSGAVFYQPSGFYIVNKPTAVIFYDIPTQHTASIAPYADNAWSRAYPFEPRYASLQRRTDVTKYFNCDLKLVNGALGDIQSLTNDGVADNLIIIRMQYKNERSTAGVPVDPSLYYFYALDAIGNNPPKVITAPVTNTFQTRPDLIKTLYGIGAVNNIVITGSSAPMGSTCAPDYAGFSYDPPSSKQYGFGAKPIIRGWKYGLASGLRFTSRAVWRRDRFGQLRDMLEQRVNTKFASDIDGSVGEAPVRVTFIDPLSGRIRSPELTQSSNLSYEATSSLPYFDGVARNR